MNKIKYMNNQTVKNTTCFKVHSDNSTNCNRTNCRHWINCSEYVNCSLIAADSGPITLEKTGEILGGLSRMRICQLERKIKNKIKSIIL